MSATVVIAPDKFKGSLTATEAAQALQRGVLAARPGARVVLCPMADGGEGTVDAFVHAGWTQRRARVHGPRAKPVDATYAVRGGSGVIEMASASGLGLLDKTERDPLHADTFGTGELIRAAMGAGARHLIVGIGGSATNDAGTGMLRALGARFLDAGGSLLESGIASYARLATIDLQALDPRLAAVEFVVAGDVDNPLCGDHGAAHTFAAQKGASPEQIGMLDRILGHVADVTARTLGRDLRGVPGAGAAGGLGFALLAFLGARMESGVSLIARELHLDEKLDGAALCLTGEGKIDEQTLHGKTVAGVADLARAHNVPVIAFGGAIDPAAREPLEQRGVHVVAIAPTGTPAAESIRNAAAFLERSARTEALRVLS